jgi:hypothetical protein
MDAWKAANLVAAGAYKSHFSHHDLGRAVISGTQSLNVSWTSRL